MSEPDEPDEDEAPPQRRGALIALVLVLVLLAGGLWLSRVLHGVGAIQDCVMSGRTNCAPVGK